MKCKRNYSLHLILIILSPLIIINSISIGEAAEETTGNPKSQTFLFLLLNGNGCDGYFGNQTVLIDSQSILYTADNSSAILRIELYGTPPVVAGTYDIQDLPYQDCNQCVLIAEGSQYFLANSGTLTVESVNPFTGSLNGAHLIEVTIDPSLISTPVPGGETRCLDNYLFNATP